MKRGKKLLSSSIAALAPIFLYAASPVFADEPVTPENKAPVITDVARDTVDSAPESFSLKNIKFDPDLADPAIIALGALTLMITGYAVGRRRPGAMLRMGMSTAILATILNPVQEVRDPLPTEVAIIVDKTASQSINSRDILTGSAYEKLLQNLSSGKNIKIRTIDVDGYKDGKPVDGTQLFTKLNKGVVEIPRNRLGAVFVLTDGQVHDAPGSISKMMNGAPLHVLLSGEENEFDRRIVVEKVPHFGFVGENQILSFRVRDDGPVPGKNETVEISVSLDGQQLSPQYAEPGETVKVEFKLSSPGKSVIELKTATVKGELTETNNRAVTSIKGIREALNVLLVSGEPTRGTRMWRELLKTDPDTNLTHLSILYPSEKQDATPLKELAAIPFPAREIFGEKLQEFDLVIFNSYKKRGLLPEAYLKKIAEYVEEGGALMVTAGDEYAGNTSLAQTVLGEILPAKPEGNVTKQAYRPEVSDPGKRHPVTRDLPGNGAWGRWFKVVDSSVSAGDVLLEGAGEKPLLVLDREADGRVAVLLSDQAWLWARGYEGGGPYAELLHRISHWLMKNPEMEEEALHMFRQNNKVIVRQQTMGYLGSPIAVTKPSGKTITVTPEAVGPGQWQASLPADELGIYSATQNGNNATVTFTTVEHDNPKEFADTISVPGILNPFVEETGGLIARIADTNNGVPEIVLCKSGEAMSGDDWMGVKMTDVSILKDKVPLVNPWLAYAIAIGFFAMALAREGEFSLRKGRKDKQSHETEINSPQGPSL
jgi:hypothetical protein